MKAALALAIAFSAATVSSSSPAEAQADAESQQVATDALKVFVDSWNRAAGGDAEGAHSYGTIYWPDAELVDPSGNVWNGQPAIIQMHVDLWGTAFKGSVVQGIVRRTRRLSPTLMIADFNLDLKVAGPLPPSIPSANGIVKAHLKNVMEKRGDEWKTVASQNTFYSESLPAR
jgi:uncharacterized protein (TIGR02246 family)